MNPVKRPPPYQEETESKRLYPQLPVISQEGNYLIKDEEDRIIETGQAETTITMYPNSKSKKKSSKSKETTTRSGTRIRRMEYGYDEQSDLEGAMGGYDPAVRRILARAERRGGETTNDSENGDSDVDLETRTPSSARWFRPPTSSTVVAGDLQRSLREIASKIDQCFLDMETPTTPERQRILENQVEALQELRKELQRDGSQPVGMRNALRSRKQPAPRKMFPVVVRGQNLE